MSRSFLVVTQIRGHIVGFSPPRLPTTVRALHCYREKDSALSSLVDSRRIVLTHARRARLFGVYREIHKLHTENRTCDMNTLVAFEARRWTTGATGVVQVAISQCFGRGMCQGPLLVFD